MPGLMQSAYKDGKTKDSEYDLNISNPSQEVFLFHANLMLNILCNKILIC